MTRRLGNSRSGPVPLPRGGEPSSTTRAASGYRGSWGLNREEAPSSATGAQPRTEDSRRRILLSALREFAENGYAKASTNAIVREARTSKGLLFHYYGSKKDLYPAALEYAVEFVVDYFLKNLGSLPEDPVDRFVAWANLKTRMLAEEPLIYKMTAGGIVDAPEEIRPELQAMLNRVGEKLMPVFLEGIDFSGLRKGIEPAKAVQYMLLVFGALSERYLQQAMNSPDKGLSGLPSAVVQIEEYADFVKHGLYRNPPE